MSLYLPGHPDHDGEPAPRDCYCGDPIQAHDDTDTCTHCTGCTGYVEHLAVLNTQDVLDNDDQLDGERRHRDNLTAAIQLEQRRRRRSLHLISGGGGAA